MPTAFRYWNVFPKTIKQSFNPSGVSIPLSIRGNPEGTPKSVDESVARVEENGWVRLGQQVGATMIVVSDSAAMDSLRYTQVEVVDTATRGEGYD